MPDPDFPDEFDPDPGVLPGELPVGGPGASAAPGGPGTVGFVADVVRRAVLTGVGALFLTEEGARKLAREWKLPKELAGFLVQQAQGAKDEALRVVGQEMRRFFESETFRRELLKLLGTMVVEVKAEVRLSEALPGDRTRGRVRVRPKRSGTGRPRKGADGAREDPAGPSQRAEGSPTAAEARRASEGRAPPAAPRGKPSKDRGE